jgi:hypothetical protein
LDEQLIANEADSSLWYTPDAEEEQELYQAAQEDAVREEEVPKP